MTKAENIEKAWLNKNSKAGNALAAIVPDISILKDLLYLKKLGIQAKLRFFVDYVTNIAQKGCTLAFMEWLQEHN